MIRKNTLVRKGRKNQKGFTALELTIVLIIGAIIIAFAASKFSVLFGKSDSAIAMSNVADIVSHTRDLKTVSGYGGDGTDLVAPLIDTDTYPKNMQVDLTAKTLTNRWGGAVTVAANATGYDVTYNNVPVSACVEMATKGANMGVVSTTLNAGTAIVGEVTSSAAITGCSAGTANVIEWSTNS